MLGCREAGVSMSDHYIILIITPFAICYIHLLFTDNFLNLSLVPRPFFLQKNTLGMRLSQPCKSHTQYRNL